MNRTSPNSLARTEHSPRRLGWFAIAAAVAALTVFVISTNTARAQEADTSASLDLTLDLGGSGGGILGDTNLTGDVLNVVEDTVEPIVDLDGTGDQVLDSVVDDIDACVINCEDALVEADVVGGQVLEGAEAGACVLGDCDRNASSSTDGAVVTFFDRAGVLESTNAQACLLADCSGNADAVSRILVNSEGNAALGTTGADICLLGDCSGSGGLDGVVGSIGSDPDLGLGDDDLIGTVDGTVCILADCPTDAVAGADDGTDETGTQDIVNDAPSGDAGNDGDSSDVPMGDPVGQADNPTGGDDLSSALDRHDGAGSADNTQQSNTQQSGAGQSGLPLAGFAPLTDNPLPLVALLLLGAAWATGAYLIRRHG